MPSPATHRREYIDWLRGIAVLCMITWHAFDAWTLPAAREPRAFGVIGFAGGRAAPLFLFLAGVSLPLAGHARMSRGLDRDAVGRSLQRRGWEIFLLAHLFRFQSFLLNPSAQWSGLLKPDILNVLGLGIVAAAIAWTYAGPERRVVWLVLAVVTALVLPPLASGWWWPSLLHPRLEAYIRPVGNYGVFALFPAVGYIFAGAFVGARLAGGVEREAGAHRWAAAGGLILAAIGWAGGLPFGAEPPPWFAPGAVVVMRVGVMSAALAGAWWLFRAGMAPARTSLVLFGRTSLIVYWVHVELAYGIFTRPIHASLPLPWAVAGFLLLTIAMLALARVWDRRPPLRASVPPHMVATSGAGPTGPDGAWANARRRPVVAAEEPSGAGGAIASYRQERQ